MKKEGEKLNIETISEALILEALQLEVSDIHITPYEKHATISFRMDHYLYDQKKITLPLYERLLSHFKFQASMDIGERRKPQNGSMKLLLKKQTIHLRLSTLPTIYTNESLVIRLLPNQSVFPLKYLSLFPSTTTKLLTWMKHSHGLILFTGPTGCGKTTTLYSLIDASKKMLKRNIITLEDPVERRSDVVLQVQVNEKAGITYSTGLKAILRHDPDVIMVGEIRDEETARIAIRAALTGHLVISTLHSKNTKGAIYRLLEFGVPFHELEQTLIAVSAQRLVEIKCPYCEQTCSPYCRKYRKHRLASVYELLYGKELKEVFKEVKGSASSPKFHTISDCIHKGIVYGYLHPFEIQKWGETVG